METATKKPSRFTIALATISPLAIAAVALPTTLSIGDQFGMSLVPFVLVMWCVLLLALAAWMNRALLGRGSTLAPFWVGAAVVLLTWCSQRIAFARLIPKEGLTYGYFLAPAGAKAHFWVLTCPFWVGLGCLFVCCVVALALWWRARAYGFLLSIFLWWFAIFVVFSLPSLHLDAQGNASIFI